MSSDRELMELRAARANSFRPAQGLKSCDVCDNRTVRKFSLATSPAEADKKEMKVVIVGGRDAGKTEILRRFKGDSEEFLPLSDLGFSHLHRTFFVGNHVIDALLWDRQKPEFSIRGRLPETDSLFFEYSIGALLVYDVTNALSVQYVPKYLQFIRRHNKSENYVIMLVGNKIDRGNHRVVTTHWGLKFADDNDLLFEEISATKGTNSEDAFDNFITEIAKRTILKKQRGQMGTGSSTEANLSGTNSGTSTEARAGIICGSTPEERARADNRRAASAETRDENSHASSAEARAETSRRTNAEARAKKKHVSFREAQAETSCPSSTETRAETSRTSSTEESAENTRRTNTETRARAIQARAENICEKRTEAIAIAENFRGTSPEAIARARRILRECTEAGERARAETSSAASREARIENSSGTNTESGAVNSQSTSTGAIDANTQGTSNKTPPAAQPEPKCSCHCTVL